MSFFISVIIIIPLSIVLLSVNKIILLANLKTERATNENIQNTYQEECYKKINEDLWQIEIPKIDLVANISEGTTKEVLDEYVGHFEETQKENGNVGLAAHNRGYKVNYFARVKELQLGDEIFYSVNRNKKGIYCFFNYHNSRY